jgi:hypothetical protein
MAKRAMPRRSPSQEPSRAEHGSPATNGNGPKEPPPSLPLTEVVRPCRPNLRGQCDAGSAGVGWDGSVALSALPA